jgi:hypothetical protein
VLSVLKEDLEGYKQSASALRFASDTPLPRALVEKLLAVRIEQAFNAKLRKL